MYDIETQCKSEPSAFTGFMRDLMLHKMHILVNIICLQQSMAYHNLDYNCIVFCSPACGSCTHLRLHV